MTLINTAIIANPVNWVVVFIVTAFTLLFLQLVMPDKT